MEIEGVENSKSTAQNEGTSSSGGSGASSSSEEDEEEYDEMDLNQDGTVSAAEVIIYEMTHSTNESDSLQVSSADSSFITEAISAYIAPRLSPSIIVLIMFHSFIYFNFPNITRVLRGQNTHEDKLIY